MKNYLDRTQTPSLFFWRDSTGNELDCLIEEALGIKCLEIKTSTTFHPDFFKGLNYYKNLSNSDEENLYLIYDGAKNMKRKEATVLSWKNTVDVI